MPEPATMGGLVETALRRFAPRTAVIAGGETRTYGQLLDNAQRFATGLAARGLRQGDAIAAMLEDRAGSLEVYLAGFLGGFTVVHVNDRLAAPELAHVLGDSGARALVHTDGLSEVVDTAGATDAVPLLVTIGSERPRGASSYDEVLAAGRAGQPRAATSPGDIGIVGYTSGTTGLSKGAMVSERALVDCVRLLPSVYRISPYGRCAFTGTLSFVAGIWGVLLPHLLTGGTVHFLHPYTPESWIESVLADRSTFSYAPTPFIPAFTDQLRQHPEALGHLESLIHSGSSVPPEQVAALVDVVGERFVEIWGMTEGVAPFSATVRDDWRPGCPADDVTRSAGRPLPTATVTVVGPDGSPLPAGETGELCVRADIGFTGYLGDPAKTAASFGPHGFRTGDLGCLDEAGYVYVTGRRTDLIVSGGANVYAAEVEAALASHPAVAECAVLGLPDVEWGEAVVAVVVLATGATATADDLVAHVRTRIAGYKRPRRVVFRDALPRTASMKVRKEVLRAELLGA